MKKSVIVIIALIIILPIAYYLISPVFRVVELDEELPIEPQINDALETMDDEIKAEFEKQTDAMKNQVMVMDDKMPVASLIAEGDFKARAHEVGGKALLVDVDGQRILRFEDFETINGPNLHIYLSSKFGDSDFIDLGKIKATKGNVNYEIPKDADLEKYNKVLIWCVPFGVLFSYAELI